jgi:integrase
MALGIPDTAVNRSVAQIKASQIQLDVASGNFDSSLKRYKPLAEVETETVTCFELFEQFIEYKKQFLDPRTLEKYRACLKYIEGFLGERKACEIDQPLTWAFCEWLKAQLSPRTAKERLSLLKAAFEYGIEQELVMGNPWVEVVATFKIPPKKAPAPFTFEEMSRIIEGFRHHPIYFYLTPYVEFLFYSGCRTAEAIGLRWGSVSDDCSTMWIGESLSKGVRKSTKTNKARTIHTSSRLKGVLLSIRPNNPSPDSLVFVTPRGSAIQENNFRNRAWEPILKELGIKYRKPYNTRHTFISHALEKGLTPATVASMTGHDIQTLYENYAGCIQSSPKLPEF